jgi:hypothetical protein
VVGLHQDTSARRFLGLHDMQTGRKDRRDFKQVFRGLPFARRCGRSIGNNDLDAKEFVIRNSSSLPKQKLFVSV